MVMKRIFLLSAIVLISFSTFAQDKGISSTMVKQVKAHMTYGIKAGLTFANAASFNPGSTTNFYAANSVTSFYLGGVIDIPIFSVLSVQPGLTLIGKGSEIVGSEGNKKYLPWYLEIPVNVLGNVKVGPGKLFFGAGPYLGIGVFGGYKDSFGSRIIRYGTNTELSGVDNDLKSLDVGLNFLLGYQLNNGLNVHGGYGLGLTNVAANSGISGDTSSFKNKLFSLGLGFAF
ncbi:MAG: PorT family protein [Pedobacter sp.]|nr:MAG: PorT family protein [Pedobacter sp.]